MKRINFAGLLVRYLCIILLGLFNLWIIYSIATPLTLILTKNLLGSLYSSIELIPACIAGSAYYLLLILNLSMPLSYKTRIKSILFLLISFFLLNILRILFFAKLYASNFSLTASLHEFTWYFGSTILVILLWFSSVKLFKIKEIPFYTDYKNILRTIS